MNLCWLCVFEQSHKLGKIDTMARKRRNRRRSRNRANVQVGGGGVPRSLVTKTCGLTDPFCIHSRGARWVDGGQAVSLTFQAKDLVVVSTNSNGHAYVVFCPNAGQAGLYYQTGANDTWTFGTPVSGNSNWITINTINASSARVVSAGARWHCIAPLTANGGSIIASEFNNFEAMDNGGVLDVVTATYSPRVECMDMRTPATWLSQATSDGAYNFVDPSIPLSDAQNARRSCLFLGINGPASVPAIAVELVINFEVVVNAVGVYSLLGGQNTLTKSDSIATKAAIRLESRVSGFFQGAYDKFNKYIEGEAWKSIKSFGFRLGSRAIGAYFGGAAGAGVAGYIADGIEEVD